VTWLLVAAGAAVGATARLLVAQRVAGARATLVVNVLGSLLLGVLVGGGPSAYALLGVGFCGAFTTYSTYAVEVVTGAGWRYAAVSTGLCLLAAAVGLAL